MPFPQEAGLLLPSPGHVASQHDRPILTHLQGQLMPSSSHSLWPTCYLKQEQ